MHIAVQDLAGIPTLHKIYCGYMILDGGTQSWLTTNLRGILKCVRKFQCWILRHLR